MSADKLQGELAHAVEPRVHITHEDDRIIAYMASRPFVSEGLTVDGALDDLVASLREYAEDWNDHLAAAPNHAEHGALVQLVNVSSDQQLREWFERASSSRGC